MRAGKMEMERERGGKETAFAAKFQLLFFSSVKSPNEIKDCKKEEKKD